VGSPQEEFPGKVEVDEERKLIPTEKVSGWRQDLNSRPMYCFSHEFVSDCNTLAS